tara:strand:+ start:389 stop:748 length:360 start_codon:yes stop_codon:yes gene_type:complete
VDELLAIQQRYRDGESYAEIARDLGVSRQWIRTIVLAPNLRGEDLMWDCIACGEAFASRSRYGPERCSLCGSFDWTDDPDHKTPRKKRATEGDRLKGKIAQLKRRLQAIESRASKKKKK